jgi:hypothetical protein
MAPPLLLPGMLPRRPRAYDGGGGHGDVDEVVAGHPRQPRAQPLARQLDRNELNLRTICRCVLKRQEASGSGAKLVDTRSCQLHALQCYIATVGFLVRMR